MNPQTIVALKSEIRALGKRLVSLGIPYQNALQEMRYALVAAALEHPSNPRHNQTYAAEKLGIHCNTVSRIAGEPACLAQVRLRKSAHRKIKA